MNEHVCDLELEVLSPCFMGGAYQQPEFRIASIRGLWRYWYRALYGTGSETACSPKEDELFGSTPGGDNVGGGRGTGGRGNARLIPTAPSPVGQKLQWERTKFPSGADYLLFSMSMQGRLYLNPPLRVSLQLRVRGSEADFDRAARSLAAALAFSGIGARARRMAGAVHLSAREDVPPYFFAPPAADPASLAARLRNIIEPAMHPSLDRRVTGPEYHIVAPRWFSAGVLRTTFTGWRDAMDRIGEAYQQFRQFDPPQSRRRRRPDYDVVKAALTGGPLPAGQTVTRAAFGLPILFRFRSAGVGTGEVRLPNDPQTREKRDRRGSPLFLTLERFADSRVAVIWCLFRSPLTPEGKIAIDEKVAPAPDLSIIDQMLKQPLWNSHPITE